MGWDTQINIIVEGIEIGEMEIADAIFESDAKDYYQNGMSFIKIRECGSDSKVLFYTYERRKYLPYWAIIEVSEKFKKNYFTVIASSPDFLGGPSGLVKITNGKIIDSYGFMERFGNQEQTQRTLEGPDPEMMFRCFGKDKLEETIRGLYVHQQPKKWIDEKYSENLLEFNEEERKRFAAMLPATTGAPIKWTAIK